MITKQWSKHINGLVFTEGIICKKAIVINDETNSNFNKRSVKDLDVDSEINELYKIISKVEIRIKTIKKQLAKFVSPNELEIFEAQIEMLNDPSFCASIVKLIKTKKYIIPQAVSITCRRIVNDFLKINNDYFKARVNDIQEISENIKNIYLGIDLLPTEWTDRIIVKKQLATIDVANIKVYNAAGVVLESNTSESHAMILAQQIGIPIIIACSNATKRIVTGETIVLDTDVSAVYYCNLSSDFLKDYEKVITKRKAREKVIQEYGSMSTATIDGYKCNISININNLQEIRDINKYHNDGVGLLRTEFLFASNSNWPSEDLQTEEYLKVAEQCKNTKAIIRTLDIGNDKKLPYYSMEKHFGKEENPVLGVRGIRFSFKQIEIFKTQIKALLRANKNNNIWIMLPLIVVVSEIKWAKGVIKKCVAELKADNYDINTDVKIGIMIETPAAVYNIEILAKYVDFFSIGTNDLIQYSFAVDRLNPNVSYLWQPLNPGLIKIINHIITVAKKNKIPCSICGSLAGNKYFIPYLIGMGLEYFSVNIAQVPLTRYLINNASKKECENILKRALKCKREYQIMKIVKDFYSIEK